MTTFATDSDEPIFKIDQVDITIQSTTTNGGVLTISQPSLRWQLGEIDHEFLWNDIMLHAVVREDVPKAQIFLQLEDNTEIHLTPSEDVCDDIFSAMCKAAELNPDEEQSEEGGGNDAWFQQDNDTKLAAYDNLLQSVVPGQFDDAVEE